MKRPFSIVVGYLKSNRGIGFKNKLPWPHIKEDMQRFTKITSETNDKTKMNAVIMGKNTWASIPSKEACHLPGRWNVVISKKPSSELSYYHTHASIRNINTAVYDSLDQALVHIAKYGSKHSEAIVTKSEQNAKRFQCEVDAAAVYWNASTRFTDGFALGLGAELGISTQKLHVRGPVGLCELTTARWLITGTGQVRY